MSNELIIHKNSSGVEIALLRDKKLIELHHETLGAGFQVGDVYLGRVRKLSPAMNAAFVEVGFEKDAFLTYFDLGPNIYSLKKFTENVRAGKVLDGDLGQFELEAQTVKTGKISQVFKTKDLIPIQVIKEPIANKGPKVTTEISLAGRYFVLVPFSSQISISRKIGAPAEKRRLRELAESLKTDNFGVIIRTVAEGVEIQELDKDLRDLIKKWNQLSLNLKNAGIGQVILGEGNRLETLLRDLLNDSFSQILIDDEILFKQVTDYVSKISPDSEKIVKLHSSKQSVFDYTGVNRLIKSSFGKSVPFSGGAYLIIEHTEALHVIDVNSGNTTFNNENRDENILKVNLEAAEEICRQIRLRDMGGIIVIDFIDMKDPKKKMELHNALRIAMKTDKAKHNILPMSKFGLVQITRERIRPALEISTTEVCPECNGTGKVEGSVQLFNRLENNVIYLWENMNQKKLTLHAHPMVIAYLTKGFPSIRMKWWFKYKKKLKMVSEPNYHITRFDFRDGGGHVING